MEAFTAKKGKTADKTKSKAKAKGKKKPKQKQEIKLEDLATEDGAISKVFESAAVDSLPVEAQ